MFSRKESTNVFARPVERWLEDLAPFGSPANVRRALRAVWRLEVDEPWKLAELGARLAAELERADVRGVLPRVLSRAEDRCGTEKLLLDFPQGKVEAVLMPEVRRESSKRRMRGESGKRDLARRPARAAGCISTQVGCAVGCVFCASGLLGLERNLRREDLIGQALVLRRLARERGRILSTLVFMGMGEPLHNPDALLPALRDLTDPCGGELGPASITVSTVGIVAGIERLSREERAPNLSLSLHAPDDETRARLVPFRGLATVEQALAAARAYARATRRFVTVSYVLLGGINDSPEQASELARLLEGSGFHVNLIPWNEVSGVTFEATPRSRAQAFWERLRARGIACHFRRARGERASAACGQLRRSGSATADAPASADVLAKTETEESPSGKRA